MEQDFNSLDAQREACAAYILSQRHEGWIAVTGIYDDGGYSGGNMDRPGLRALLADISSGKVDIIVVYKVDRLTRSLADFAKIVDVLDARSASFVSVTQSFNTTTSMGRLTLNVLLSFAQFEREVTGERIRDKVAASKAKGMWMGGPVPLGYDLRDRRLIINEREAATVRHIFNRYLALKSGRLLVAELETNGIRSKHRTDRHGKAYGGKIISRGAVYIMLQNRLYVGEVVHKGRCYPGQHAGIIDAELFDEVQRNLELGRVERRTRSNAKEASLLAGLLRDAYGRRMSPSHVCKQAKRYRYYVSQNDGDAARAQPAWRITACEIESLVIALLRQAIDEARNAAVNAGSLGSEQVMEVDECVADTRVLLGTPHDPRTRQLVATLISGITLAEDQVRVSTNLASLGPAFALEAERIAVAPINCVRTTKQVKLILPAPTRASDTYRDPALVKLVVQGQSLRATVDQHQAASSFDELAEALGYSREHAADLPRIGFLAPDIISAIIDGRQPNDVTRTELIKMPRLPLDWQCQRAALGFA